MIAAASALAALAIGAVVIAWLEPRLASRREPGPAWPAPVRERVRVPAPDPWMRAAGPLLGAAAVAAAAVVIPLGPDLVAADLDIGLFYFIVVVDLVVVALALSGWGGNTRGSVEACYRAVAQMVAYVVPLGLAVIGPIMMARSMSAVDIVRAQSRAGLWYALVQPLGFALYLVTGLMQSYRAPFLEPFARRIEGGVLGVSGGWQALVWRLVLAALLLLVAAMGAVLFLGGWMGPLLPGWLWMILKTLALAALMVGGGARLQPRSTAATLALGWKLLIPVGLANVLFVGGLILIGVGQP